MHLQTKTRGGGSLKKCIRPFTKAIFPIFFCALLTGLYTTAKAAGGRDHFKYAPVDTTIKGIVTDSAGTPLQGVSVNVRGTKNGTTTDAAGAFILKNVPDGATLVFTNVGYQANEIRLRAGQSTVSVSLAAGAGALENVVVTGFQRINRRNFAGAAVKLNAEDIKINGVVDVSRMLEGRAAGVSIQNVSGTFGAAPKVRVRGATSITGENKPLWVVDGVVLEDIVNISNDQLSSGDPNTLLGSAVAGLNANDIESFDILKDASAVALYGARAMNGVIVITTKRGRVGKPLVNYTGNFTMQLKPSYSNYDIMNSADQISIYAELERKGSLLLSSVANAANAGIYGKLSDAIYNPLPDGSYAVENTPAGHAAFLNRYGKANTDWFDILFKNSVSQEHSISISSGTDKAQTYFSTSFFNDQGWTIADKVKRYTANLTNTYNFSNRFTARFNVAAAVRQQRAPGTISRVSNPVEGSFDREFDINPFSYSLNTSRLLTAYDENGKLEYFRRNFAPFNIINELANNYIDLTLLDAKLQGGASYKITPHLTYEFTGAIRIVKTSKEHQITEHSNQAQAYRVDSTTTLKQNNRYLYSDPSNPSALPVVVLPYGGFYNRNEDQLSSYTVRNQLNFNQTFHSDHLVTGVIGQELRSADRQNANNTGYGYQYENGGVPFVDYRILKQAIENSFQYYGMGNQHERFVGFFGNANYTYKGKYTLSGTGRVDGSNRLGKAPSARWLPTWTVAGRWNVEQEDFMKNIDKLSYLTLRGSYGLNASYGSATNSAAVLRTQITNRVYAADNQVAITLANLENAELTWEKKYEANIGLDAGLLNGRINVSLDAYNRRSFDLINLVRTAGIGGEVTKQANYADLKSHGFEATINGTIIKTKNWSWTTNFTFGYNTTKITNAKNDPLLFDLIVPEGGAKEGYPVRGLFSIPFVGLDPQSGIAIYRDDKGDTAHGVYLQSDSTQYLKYEGSIDPTITGGLTNTIRYKNFSLNFLLVYQAGNKIRLAPAYRGSYTDLDAMPNEFKNRWTLPGDEKYTNVPSVADLYASQNLGYEGAYPYNNYNYSSARVVDGSFIRLKTVGLNYQLSQRLTGRMGIGTVNFSLSANNLWLIYSDKNLHGQDPEFFNAGGVALPINKQFVLSLKVGI